MPQANFLGNLSVHHSNLNIFSLAQFSVGGTTIYMEALKEFWKILFFRKKCLYFFSYLQKAKYKFWWNTYSEWMLIIFRHVAGIPLHFMHSKRWNFQSIWIPYSKIQLAKYCSRCQWHSVDFESACWKTLLSDYTEDQGQKRIGADHYTRKWNANLLLMLTIKWEENLEAGEALHK